MKERHLICEAHIDPIWQWNWPEGVSAMLSTFRSAVNLAKEFDYIFCHNEAVAYRYIERYAPDLFEEIRALVKQGKWHIMGGWFLQPDCNMPCGESLVRNALIGRRYFLEKFGKAPTTAINFDPFGHSVGIVQIIKKCGQDSYLFMRPYDYELTLPAEQFLWRGLDGSEIKAVRCDTYSSKLGKAVEEITEREEKHVGDYPVDIVLWGVGNHGGGPSRKDLSDIERELFNQKDVRYLHSTPEVFFEKIHPTVVFDRSLHIAMPGCYTAMHSIKSLHARLESEYFTAEKLVAVACERGALAAYPHEALALAVEDLINAEFHDVLPGSGVPAAEDAGVMMLRHGLAEAERVKVDAFFSLLAHESAAQAGEYPIFVFNPHPYIVTENVECEFILADQNRSDDVVSRFTVLDRAGNEIAHQVIKEESNIAIDWRKRILFRATLAPFEFARFSVFAEFVPIPEKKPVDTLVFVNEKRRVEINPETGLLSYTVDGVEYVRDGFSLVTFEDNQDPWAMSAEQQKRVGENERPFRLSATPRGAFADVKSVQVIEDGALCTEIEAFFEQDETNAHVRYRVYHDTLDVDVFVRVYNFSSGKVVKLKIPTPQHGRLIGQTVFGTEELFDDARENVSHRFIALENGGKCLAVLNDSTYGSHYEKNALYLSLLRATTYCAHPIDGRPITPTDRYTPKIDQGEQHFAFRLTLCPETQLERKAQVFVQKPYALHAFPATSDPTPLEDFAPTLTGDVVSLVAMKRAEDGQGIIFRLQNNSREHTGTVLTVGGASIALDFTPYEVKTVILAGGALRESERFLI